MIGQEIKILRQRSGILSIESLTHRINRTGKIVVSFNTIRGMEAGQIVKGAATVGVLHAIAAVMGRRLSLGEDDDAQVAGATTTVEELLRLGIIPHFVES